MKESIGMPNSIYIICVFMIIVFIILVATLSYFKAYKVNQHIVGTIEKYEGYNDAAIEEINRFLGSIGYTRMNVDCPEGESGAEFPYCIALKCDESDPYLYHYKVITYIRFEFPIINKIVKLPISAETNSIHNMEGGQCG